jgi:methionyl aminopeptidase
MDLQYKQDFIKAGQIAKEVRTYGKSLIVKGASYNDVISKVKGKIKELGAIPAFPPQIALDDVAAHFLPQPDNDIIFSNELVKLDVGICVNGAIGDTAVSIDLSGKHQNIIDAAEAALLAAEKIIRVGMTVSELGREIEKTIASYGLRPVRNLTGHGLAKNKIHTDPHIPNYDDKSKLTIKAGMTFAIEPFATNGTGMIFDAGNATLFSLIKRKGKYTGFVDDVFKIALSFEGLPFCTHDLISEKTPLELVKKAIKVLLKDDALEDYAPLVEEARGMVAQAENSVLVDENGTVFITTR